MYITCINVDYQVNCIEKFFNSHDNAFIDVWYEKIDSCNCMHTFTGSYEVNGNTEYFYLFSISGENKIVNEKVDLIFELCDL
jgi:hypothetical protein